MPCFRPLDAWQAVSPNANGKRPVAFEPSVHFQNYVQVPCGQCVGCRLERSRQWAMRCVHEASLYRDNCFLTLTYDDQHLPFDGSLRKRDFQLFMKRFRKKCGSNIRFFHCGEYGEKTRRPHYHACIFNYDFPDKVLYNIRDGNRLFISPILSGLWPFGFSTIGALTFETAAYTARYIMKKVTGDGAEDHYTVVDPNTGEVYELQPEYTTMSRRPGIGAEWYKRFKSDVYPSDEVVIRGQKMKPPKFYDKLLDKANAGLFEIIKEDRIEGMRKHEDEVTPERLAVRERVQLERAKRLVRNVE